MDTDPHVTTQGVQELPEQGGGTRETPSSEGAAHVHIVQKLPFAEFYKKYFPFVWRCVRAQGVQPSALDDAVQEVFIVVHRRRDEFEGRASPQTWLFAICQKVAANQRRTVKRKGGGEELSLGLSCNAPTPIESAQEAQAAQFVQQFADALDDAKRPVFVMCLLERMSVPEAAEALEANVNTIYSRLSVVRSEFKQAMRRRVTQP